MNGQNIIAAMLHASDCLRRSMGLVLDNLNKGPIETQWEPMLSHRGFTLRCYGNDNDESPPLLIVPAPIKRPYIFDLMPAVSVVRRLLAVGFSVYLIDWREADPDSDLSLT